MLAATRIMFRQRKPYLWQLIEGNANEVCWPSVLNRLDSHPEETRWVSHFDGRYNTFLHRILIKRRANLPLEVVEKVIACYPKALKIRNAFGRTPLHLAIDGSNINHVSVAIILLILRAYPKGVSVRSSRGYLPVHYALVCPLLDSLNVRHDTAPSPSILIGYHMLTNRNIMIAKLLLETYPASVRKLFSKKRHKIFNQNDLMVTVFDLWKCKHVCGSFLYKNLCELTDIIIRVAFVSLYGRSYKYFPLHVLLMEKCRPLENIRLRHYLLIERYSNELTVMNKRKQLCLHIALRNGYTWTTGIKEIYEGERRATEVKDISRLYPFMSAGIYSDLDTIYNLLRCNPSILKLC